MTYSEIDRMGEMFQALDIGPLKWYLHDRSIDELRSFAKVIGIYGTSMRRHVVLINAIVTKKVSG